MDPVVAIDLSSVVLSSLFSCFVCLGYLLSLGFVHLCVYHISFLVFCGE